MANFQTAFKKTGGIEAGYTVDNGGPTYQGIAFNSWKNDSLAMQIYKMVAAAKPVKRQVINNAQLNNLIAAFYKKNYWDRIYGDRISNQTLADFIYDFYVNSNSAPAIINRAIGTRGAIGFTEDTLRQLNDKPAYCYVAIRDARKAWYDRLAKNNKKFYRNGTYNGWLSRLDKFPDSLTA